MEHALLDAWKLYDTCYEGCNIQSLTGDMLFENGNDRTIQVKDSLSYELDEGKLTAQEIPALRQCARKTLKDYLYF